MLVIPRSALPFAADNNKCMFKLSLYLVFRDSKPKLLKHETNCMTIGPVAKLLTDVKHLMYLKT